MHATRPEANGHLRRIKKRTRQSSPMATRRMNVNAVFDKPERSSNQRLLISHQLLAFEEFLEVVCIVPICRRGALPVLGLDRSEKPAHGR